MFRVGGNERPKLSDCRKKAMNTTEMQRLVRRGRANATQAGLALCVEWTTWCRNNGWAEEHLLELEGLFWKYRDSDGNLKAPNGPDEQPRN
jgi:hypothetical protein